MKEVTSKDEKNPQGWYFLGIALERSDKQNHEALTAYEKAEKLIDDTTYTEEMFNIRFAYISSLLKNKEYNKAKAQIDLLLKSHPNHPAAIYVSAVYAYMKKNSPESEQALYKVIKSQPNHLPSILLLGSIHFSKGSYEQANEYLTFFVNEARYSFHTSIDQGSNKYKSCK